MENKDLFVKVISTSVACGQEISWCHQKPCSVHSCYKYGTLVVELGFVLLYVCLLYFKKRVVFPLWKTSFNNTNFRIFFFLSSPSLPRFLLSLSCARTAPMTMHGLCTAFDSSPGRSLSQREPRSCVCVLFINEWGVCDWVFGEEMIWQGRYWLMGDWNLPQLFGSSVSFVWLEMCIFGC